MPYCNKHYEPHLEELWELSGHDHKTYNMWIRYVWSGVVTHKELIEMIKKVIKEGGQLR